MFTTDHLTTRALVVAHQDDLRRDALLHRFARESRRARKVRRANARAGLRAPEPAIQTPVSALPLMRDTGSHRSAA